MLVALLAFCPTRYLPRAYENGPTDFEARERVHSAATIAGALGRLHSTCVVGCVEQSRTPCTLCTLWLDLQSPDANAGMAFANAFLGVCHSMAHKLGARFHVPHGARPGCIFSTTPHSAHRPCSSHRSGPPRAPFLPSHPPPPR